VRRSLVLITVDCLRADHTGLHGYSRPTTPFLDSLGAESLVFENAVVGGTPTYYSFPAIMSSRHPLSLGRDVTGLAPAEPTLALALKEAGYGTAAFLGGNPYLSARFGYHEGFDTFRNAFGAEVQPLVDPIDDPTPRFRRRVNRILEKACRTFGPLGLAYDELYFRYCLSLASPVTSLDSLRRCAAADALVDQACAWLDTLGDRPFFLWLHFMDPHAPYYPLQKGWAEMGSSNTSAAQARYLNSYWNRSDLSSRRLGKVRAKMIELYDAGIRGVDSELRRLVESLRAHKRWDDCNFVITADHGEEFMEHAGRFHAPSKLMEELIHVPLLLRVPGGERGRVTSVFSHLDLPTTLLQSMDAPIPPGFRGRNRWKQLQSRETWDDVAIVECIGTCTNPFSPENRLGARILAARTTRFKLILDFALSRELLFDLACDPGELKPLPPTAEPQVRRRLLRSVREHLQQSVESRDMNRRIGARLREICQQPRPKAIRIPA
jgi:arylsulfatase A-like enzyme